MICEKHEPLEHAAVMHEYMLGAVHVKQDDHERKITWEHPIKVCKHCGVLYVQLQP